MLQTAQVDPAKGQPAAKAEETDNGPAEMSEPKESSAPQTPKEDASASAETEAPPALPNGTTDNVLMDVIDSQR
jgi:hypothetical protein